MSQSPPTVIVASDFPGGNGIQAIQDFMEAVNSSNSGPTAPPYAVNGTPWLDTTLGAGSQVYKMYNGTIWVTLFTGI